MKITLKKMAAIFAYGLALLIFINEAESNISPYIKGEINIDSGSIAIIVLILLMMEKFIIVKLDNFYALASLFLVIIITPALILNVLLREFSINTLLFIFTSIFPLIIIKAASISGLAIKVSERTLIPSMRIVVAIGILLFMIFFTLSYKSFYLSSFDDIYEQRFKNSTTGIMAYLQIYAGFAFPLITLTLGLFRKNIFYIAFSLIAIIYFYGIMAHKSVLVSTLLIISFYWINGKPKINTSNHILNILTAFILIVLILAITPLNESIMNWMRFIIVRSIFIPAITYIDYHDAANVLGFTYFQNIHLVKELFPATTIYESMPGWPFLDLILGNYFEFGETTGYNAGQFPTSYIMGGLLTVIASSLIFVTYLAALEHASSHLDRRFKLTLVAPFLYMLSNIPFHTFLISFGGLLILIIFYISPRERNH